MARAAVPEDRVPWSVPWPDYSPTTFTAPFVPGVSALHPDARAIGFHTKFFKKLDTKTKKGPPNCFLRALLLLKWINMVNSNPLKE